MVVVLGVQPAKAWLEGDVLACARESERVGSDVWACVAEHVCALLCLCLIVHLLENHTQIKWASHPMDC